MRRAALLTTLALPLLAGPLHAEEAGLVAQGRAFAQRVCAECHAVQAGPVTSPLAAAPTFAAIAATPDMSPIALRVTLRSSHSTMPNLVLAGDELDGVIAYIMSLRTRN